MSLASTASPSGQDAPPPLAVGRHGIGARPHAGSGRQTRPVSASLIGGKLLRSSANYSLLEGSKRGMNIGGPMSFPRNNKEAESCHEPGRHVQSRGSLDL